MLLVSADGHAVMPEALWSQYLEKEFHDYLPRLSDENRRFTSAMLPMNDYDLMYEGVVEGSHYDVFDPDEIYRSGRWAGAWDREIRLSEMDREGVAAEFVFNGYYRATDLFFNVSNTVYPHEVAAAGVRAHNRWLFDTFGPAKERLLLVGAVGRSLDMDETVRELNRIADQGFIGTYAPGFSGHPDLPPLYHPYWEPAWQVCADRGLTVVIHGGYGMEPGGSFDALTGIFEGVHAEGGSDRDAIKKLRATFNDSFFTDMRARRPLWQLTLGGVFDRHPELRVMLTEIRGDWLPATLDRLDAAFEEHRDQVPAVRKPSEYWPSNLLAGLSFMHRVEVERRHEIGVEKMSFGRDYPHTEGTWPNTKEYLQFLLAGVPEDEARMLLGENLAHFLKLNMAELAPVVERIGFHPEDVLVENPELDPDLVAHFNARCGLGKPFEGDSKIDQLEPLLAEDLARVGGR
ncbi:MAG TPA: amidohydrolase family protein [Acidimicrobiales bacterium]